MTPKELQEFLSECPRHLDMLADVIPFSRAFIQAFAADAVPMNRNAQECIRTGIARVRRMKSGCNGCDR